MQHISKAKLKLFTSLHTKKFRYRHQMFLIEGKKLVQEALESKWPLESIILREDKVDTIEKKYTRDKFCVADTEVFKDLSRLQQSEGILAVVRFPTPEFCAQKELEELPKGQGFILEEIQDPGNLGTLMRSMDWMGISNLILGPGCVDPLNLKTLRSSMGAIFRTKICKVPDIAGLLHTSNQQFYIAHMEGISLQKVDFSSDSYVILGNEANGISPVVQGLPISKISIPRLGAGESLNAGVAGSIIAWEMAKSNAH